MVEKKVLRNAVLFGPVVQLMFIVTVLSTPIDPYLFYIVFLLILLWPVYLYERDNPREKVVDTSQYSLATAPAQAWTGLLVGGAVGLPIILFGTFTLAASTPREVVFQALFVTFVETLYLIVIVRTIWAGDFPAGVVAWPFIFGFLHVRVQVVAGDIGWDVAFRFAYSFLFGVLFWILYAAREMGIGPWRDRFGAVTTWTAHLAVNLVITLFPLELMGFQFFPLVFGGLYG